MASSRACVSRYMRQVKLRYPTHVVTIRARYRRTVLTAAVVLRHQPEKGYVDIDRRQEGAHRPD